MEKINLFFDFILGRLVVDQVRSYGIDTKLLSLQSRIDAAETNIGIITGGGVPVYGSYTFGEWTDHYDSVVEFAGWTV